MNTSYMCIIALQDTQYIEQTKPTMNYERLIDAVHFLLAFGNIITEIYKEIVAKNN